MIPKESTLLLGPRGTGKSTWIRQNFPDAPLYDLLNTREALRLSRDPSVLFKEASNLKSGTWVVIDEVQKVPGLLDEVHRLMEEKRLKFLLSGSSARKLRRGGTNLLAGRARLAQLFPLASAEVDFKIEISHALNFGMLPMSYTSDDPVSYLKAYADVYLQEEIKGEALTRNLGSFSRFLEVAARQNGQITNVSGISRDAQISRQTVQGYFDILDDTLLGSRLEPWKLKRSTKQVAHPKFYFFDAGVARALSERLPYPPTSEEAGPLLETLVLGEVRAYLSYAKLDYPIYFWSSHDGVEVDLFLETGRDYLAVELKSSQRWETRFGRGLARIREEMGGKKVRTIGVYTGEREALFGDVRILPLIRFLRELWDGDMIR